MCLQQPLLCSFQIDQDEKITYMYDQWNQLNLSLNLQHSNVVQVYINSINKVA